MGEWKPDTIDGWLRKANKVLDKYERVGVGAANKADDAQFTADGAAEQAAAAAETADQANDAAQAAVDAAAAAAQQALDAAGLAAGKGKVIFSATQPTGDDQNANNLWIDTSGSPPKYTPNRWDGTGWSPVTDKAATDAAAAAAQAASDAANAVQTANQAVQTANAAQTAATNAQTAANGKNTVRYRTAAPTTSAADKGTADGDIWWVIPNVQTGIVTGQYVWMAATQSWVQQTLNQALLSSIDAGKITTGTLTGVTITGVTITGATVTGGTVQTSSTGKRVVLANNRINFYGVDGQAAVNAGYIEGVPNGAAGGMMQFASSDGGTTFLILGTQALPTFGSATVVAPGIVWTQSGIYDSAGVTSDGPMRLTRTNDASLTSTAHAFQIGPDQGTNLILDNNEIMARNNGATTGLYINGDGGNIGMGDGNSQIQIPGRLVATHYPYAQAQGQASYGSTVNNNSAVNIDITFPSGRFNRAPRVVATASNPRLIVGIESITASGCTLRLGNWSGAAVTGGVTVDWIATQASSTNSNG